MVGLIVVVGCAGPPQPRPEAYDPLENMNRSFHVFNTKVDELVMQPVVDAYIDWVHENWRLSISNFFDNLSYPNVIVNTFLQGKFRQGFVDTGRFLINTTLGVGGLFDAASVFGLEEHDEDFGQTLAVWGVGEGPYLTLPFLGPSTMRDLPDLGGSALTNVFTYVGTPVLVAGVAATSPLAVLAFIDKRARADRALRARDELALDSYVFTREAYRQHRTFLIYDGNPPMPELFAEEDLQIFEDLEQEDAVDEHASVRQRKLHEDLPTLEPISTLHRVEETAPVSVKEALFTAPLP
ncbi:MAG: VacJ family lipoprotein [Nitrospirae bacterium]|nr:MAG: VacJ family lipoprotein [Nitrospirota bacterium]